MLNLRDLVLANTLFGGGSSGGGGNTGGGSTEEWIGDGNTHIWISLPEGGTSIKFSAGIDGTYTVDWGDGTTPDTVSGRELNIQYVTPDHNYAAAGEYVIAISVSGNLAFPSYCGLQDAEGYYYWQPIQKVEIGNGVTSIANNAFSECYNLTSAKIPEGITSIPENCFSRCVSLTSVNIPESVTSIGNYAFQYCGKLASAKIPEGVTSIGSYTFRYCIGLASVNIPESVTNIAASAFQFGLSIRSIRFERTTPPSVASANAFANLCNCCVISVPVGSLEAYTTATNYPDPATYTYIEE